MPIRQPETPGDGPIVSMGDVAASVAAVVSALPHEQLLASSNHLRAARAAAGNAIPEIMADPLDRSVLHLGRGITALSATRRNLEAYVLEASARPVVSGQALSPEDMNILPEWELLTGEDVAATPGVPDRSGGRG